MSGENDTYRLCVVKHASLSDPTDLTATLDWIVKRLADTDPLLFSLSGYSPAMHAVPLLDGEKSLVEGFLAVSEIAWNFGREPADPTHEVVFFNGEEGTRNVYLRASFVAGGAAGVSTAWAEVGLASSQATLATAKRPMAAKRSLVRRRTRRFEFMRRMARC